MREKSRVMVKVFGQEFIEWQSICILCVYVSTFFQKLRGLPSSCPSVEHQGIEGSNQSKVCSSTHFFSD